MNKKNNKPKSIGKPYSPDEFTGIICNECQEITCAPECKNFTKRLNNIEVIGADVVSIVKDADIKELVKLSQADTRKRVQILETIKQIIEDTETGGISKVELESTAKGGQYKYRLIIEYQIPANKI